MPFNFRLQESDAAIAKKAMAQIASSLNRALMHAVPIVGTKIKALVGQAIQSSPEWKELHGGILQAELGVPQSSARLKEILDIWMNSLRITRVPVKLTGTKISGGFAIGMIEQNWADVLSSPSASYVTEKGTLINWLEWLLIAGDKTIISKYYFTSHVGPKAKSRTGLGIMRQNNKSRWHVPREFSGTAQNNFVTRSLDKIAPLIIQTMQTEFEKRIV